MPGKLNARERWGLLLIDEQPDRPPVYPLITAHAATVNNCDLISYCSDGKKLAEAQLAAFETYGHDGLSVFTDVGIIAEAFGSKYHLREDDVPILDRPLISTVSKIDQLQVPDPGSSGRLPAYLAATDFLYTRAGDLAPVFVFIPCPFTTAAGLRGVDEFLMDTILEPQAAQDLLEISLQAAIRLCDESILAGGLPVLVDPLASGSVISRQTYQTFALPSQQKLISYLHRSDLDITLHVCGDMSRLVDLVAATGADLFSFDKLDPALAVETLGDQIRLVGNIPPHELLASSEMDIEVRCHEIAQHGLANPKGFVLSTGCEVPIRCDCHKLETMIKFGKQLSYRTR